MNEGNLNAGHDATAVAPASSAEAYEFSDTENKTVGRTATWAKALALMFFFQVFLQLLNLNIFGIVLDLAIGISFWKGAELLRKVVETKDDDIPNMLGALDQLRNAFTIRIVVTGIAAVLGIIVSVGFFVQYEFLYDAEDGGDPAATIEDAEEEDVEGGAASGDAAGVAPD